MKKWAISTIVASVLAVSINAQAATTAPYHGKHHPATTARTMSPAMMPTDIYVYNDSDTNVVFHVSGTDFYELVYAHDYDEITNDYQGGMTPVELFIDDGYETPIWNGVINSHASVQIDEDFWGRYVVRIR